MWNNRIVKLQDSELRTYYAACEVFYNDNGAPNGYAIIEDLVGESPEDVKALVSLIYHDIVERDVPVLDEHAWESPDWA